MSKGVSSIESGQGDNDSGAVTGTLTAHTDPTAMARNEVAANRQAEAKAVLAPTGAITLFEAREYEREKLARNAFPRVDDADLIHRAL